MEVARTVIAELALLGIAVMAILVAVFFAFGSVYPFYVVVSGSMVPTLEIKDMLIVTTRVDFEDIRPGDVILFNRPSEYAELHDPDLPRDSQTALFDRPDRHGTVIVHRVIEVLEDNPRVLMTQGDANPGPIPGTDYPVSGNEYLGKMVYAISGAGAVTDFIRPPVSYALIAVVIGLFVAYELHTHPKWQWRLILLAFQFRDRTLISIRMIKYDPKSRKAQTIFVRQGLKNYFAVILLSAGMANRALKAADAGRAAPADASSVHKNALLAVARAGTMLDMSQDLLDAAMAGEIRSLLSKIESVSLESGVGEGYPDYEEIKKRVAHCTGRLDSMGDDAVLR